MQQLRATKENAAFSEIYNLKILVWQMIFMKVFDCYYGSF